MRSPWYLSLLACSVVAVLSGCGAELGDETAQLQQALTGPTVVSVALSPSTIAGGSGGTSQGTVTLSAPAPAGGLEVALTSSNLGLAAPPLKVTVPAGATSATFNVATNALYRRYSGLGFTATVSASANGSTSSAVLTVTAQPRPPDIFSDSNQREGLMCGGTFPASQGERGILYKCSKPVDFGSTGKCTFQQECLAFGCQTKPPNNFSYSHACATSGTYPVALSQAAVVGGGSTTVTATLPGPAGTYGNDAYIYSSSPAAAVPLYHHLPPEGTTVSDTVTTSYVPTTTFAAISVNAERDQASGSSTFISTRTGLTWLAVLEGGTPPPPPTVASVVINIDPVKGGNSSTCTVTLTSNTPPGGASVTLTSSDPSVALVPSPIVIGAGYKDAMFTITTRPVTANTPITITGSYAGTSQSDTFTVTGP